MRLSRFRTATVAVTLVAAGLVYPAIQVATSANAATTTKNVTANLFEWPWPSVQSECTNVLGPAGFGAVQVAPPEDSISVSGHPWWDVYQPAAYDLNSRMGTRAQFAAMVSACHAAGVKVYVDAVINHMTGANQSGTTSYGGAVFNNNYSYTTAGYSSGDFHHYPGDCPNSDNQIHDWNNQTDVQECQLVNLSDLRTESDSVRSKIAAYLNDLISLGVDGFRVDAAKHMNVNDVAAIKAKLTAQPFWYQEVMPGSPGGLSMPTYEATGSLLEFNYADDLKNQFTGNIANLQTFGTSWGLEPSNKAVVFVENHDTERNGSTLSYKNGTTDTLANVFMLAWNYGVPNVMSSFDFANTDQSPPADANGYVTPVTCGSGWECQQRKPAILGMVGFHNVTEPDTTVSNWWTDGSNEIAFSRGPASAANGWITIDNGSNALSNHVFTTGMAAGTYCDVIHGSVVNGACTGPTVAVGSGGTATVSVASKDAVAIDTASLVSGVNPSPTPTTSPSPTPSPTSTVNPSGVAVTFSVTGAPANYPIYLVGSIPQLGSWAPASAVPMTENGGGWSTTVTLPAGTAIQYKFIAKDTSGNVTWETGANHSATTPASGSTTIANTWNGSTSSVSAAFHVTATTWTGQKVYAVGSVTALGSWNVATAIPLTASGSVWSGAATLPPNTAFAYKYVKVDPDGTIEWESGANRTSTTPASGSVAFTDTWQGTASQITSITFKANATTIYGQNVYVVGSIADLGGWNTANAIALSSATYPVWAGTVTLPAGTYFEYKYVKKDAAGTVIWESGTNRSSTTPSSGSVTLNDTWK
jgi:alpha-amylase